MARIYVENGLLKGRSYAIVGEGTILIGRHEGAQIAIPDPMLSRRHCQLEHRDGRIWIRDLGSTNGTHVNGGRVESTRLEIGDRIQIGDTLLTLLGDRPGEGFIGRTIGGYRILDRIGRGGMGTVWKARQVSLDRTVALKLLSEDLTGDPAFVAAFIREARAAGELSHPNIVGVFDVASEGDLYFFSMEYLEGGSVESRIAEEGKIPPHEALRIARDAARGLEYAESKGIVHRDIKPGNLLLTREGTAKIGDLGIARRAAAGGAVRQEEGVSGSPHYMAPEQALGRELDGRADLYALGVSLYQMLTGRTPFTGKTPKEVILKRLREPPPSVRRVDPSIPEPVAQLVRRLMARRPDERFASAAELVAAAHDCLRRGLAAPSALRAPPRRLLRAALIAALFAAAAVPAALGVRAVIASYRARAAVEREIRSRAAQAERRLEAGDPAGALRILEAIAARYPGTGGIVPLDGLRRQAEEAHRAQRRREDERLARKALEGALAALEKGETEGRRALEAVIAAHPGTGAAARAREEIDRLQRLARERAALGEEADLAFQRCRARARPCLEASDFRRALAVWRDFPARYAGTAAAGRAEAERAAIGAQAAEYVAASITAARRLAEEEGFAQARLALESARGRLVDPAHLAAIDRELEALGERARAAREREARARAQRDMERLAEGLAAAAAELRGLRIERAREQLAAREILLESPEVRETLEARLRDLDAVGGFLRRAFDRAGAARPIVALPGVGEVTIAGLRAKGITFRRKGEAFSRRLGWRDLGPEALVAALGAFARDDPDREAVDALRRLLAPPEAPAEGGSPAP